MPDDVGLLRRMVQDAAEQLVELKKETGLLIETIEVHDIESLQCDGKEAEYCDCLTKQAAKTKLLLT